MAITNERLVALETALKEAGDEIVAELEKLRNPASDAEAEASMQRLEALGEKLRNLSPPIPPTP